MPPYLFVYGTLRPDSDHPMGRWLAGRSTVVGTGKATGKLVDMGDFPGLQAGDDTIVGTVLSLRDARDLAKLDAYEGVPGLFIRERWPVSGPHGTVEAWVYVLVGDP